MTRLFQLMSVLAEKHADRVADARLVRGNELHCRVLPPAIPALAAQLRMGFGAELVFMAAGDRRADRGVFEVSYLFGPERENWLVHAAARRS